MPEGDSLYRFADRLRPVLEGQVVQAARSHGPGPVPKVHLIVGATCTAVRAQGKNMLISFDNGLALRGHLRMYGTWHIYTTGEPWTKPEREARLVLEVPGATVVNFSAPVIELIEERAIDHYQPIAGLGPNLLDDDFDADEVFRRLRDPARAALTIGDAIMDQRAMAGVGNIWKHETLFRCGINPWRTVGELSDDEVRTLVAKARELLRASVGNSDGTVVRPRRPAMYVYKRSGQPCRRCFTRLRSAPQGEDIRYTTWCPNCQPMTDGQRVQPSMRRRNARPGLGA
ncbi:MAG: Fpg/Nei family DNA glycosylase [Dehalococcoidia bacterium]|nr:Fpg/Nei family DNA glycosylase [Dehalococcoidia bacterium]